MKGLGWVTNDDAGHTAKRRSEMLNLTIFMKQI
jgi:hypothetical protein